MVKPRSRRSAIVTLLTAALITSALIVSATAALTVRPAGAAPPGIDRKRAEARLVLNQIQELDVRTERATEAYNLATIRLAEIANDVRANARDVTIARSNLRRAQQLLSAHLIALYTADAGVSGLEALLGAESISELIDRFDAQDRISNQDRILVQQVTAFRRAMLRKQAELARARTLQGREVARRTAQRREIEWQLGERQRLLSTIEDEITRLEAAERARQQRLRRQLQVRVEAQRREEDRLAAAAAASRKAAGDASPPPPPEPKPESLLGIAAATPDGPAVIPPARFSGVVGLAMRYLGVPYVWGGASPAGFDCSGFILYVYAQLGVSLPHHAASQYGYGSPVPKESLEPGDLVFFDNLGHNGIYVGGGQFIHAPHTGDVVKISSLSDAWYASHWTGARRL